MTARHGGWLVLATIALALVLTVVQVPQWLRWTHPEWVAMVVIYWVMALPDRIGVGVAWICGLLLDVAQGTPLGEHAFALAVIAYLTQMLYQRMRMFAVWQQAFIIFVLIGLYELICHWIENITDTAIPNLLFLLPAVMSALFWPVVMVSLRSLRRAFAVS